MSPAASSRWCPTPEQLMILEELYRSGIRTPNASQIQKITAHLSLYGKIEGKNVFYWFQNHKARDRQKLRRKLIKQLQQQQQQQQVVLYHHDQPQENIIPPNHHLLNYFDPPPSSSAFHQFSYQDSACYLPQGGHEGAPTQMMNYMWKMGVTESRVHIESPMMKMYGHDWMMMEEDQVGPTPPPNPCWTRPLKTLELFPIKATNLKEECKCNTSSTAK